MPSPLLLLRTTLPALVAGLALTGPGAAPTAAASSHPAKLQVLRAGVKDGRLDVLAKTTSRADGDAVNMTFHANGRRYAFSERVREGSIRFRRVLSRAQRGMSSGILEIEYPGNGTVRPAFVRLRAANGKARLTPDHLSLRDGVLRASGTVSSRARGVVRVTLGFQRPDDSTATWKGRAKIAEGRWSVAERLPADAAAGGYLSMQFTGYLKHRMRGEQISKQLLAGQAFGASSSRKKPRRSKDPAPTSPEATSPEPTSPEAPASGDGSQSSGALFSDGFSAANGANGLITNQYAFWSSDLLGVRSPNWEVTSGSLFSQNGMGWSGRTDAVTPDRYSQNGTGSYVFRMRTKQAFTGSVRQQVDARINSFWGGTTSRPAVAWDGVVLWPRYVSERQLYFAYILRKDGRVGITKKCEGQLPGGGYYNGGTYFSLYDERFYAATTTGKWYRLATEVTDNADGTVTVSLFRDGQLAAQATDRGVGCPPITGSARLGIRADNTDFNIDDYTVTRLP